MKVYADNAATTRMSRRAVKAMLPFMRKNFGNPSGLYSMSRTAADSLQKAKETLAKNLGCEAKEITFTSGGTEADNLALISAAEAGKEKGKNHIISSAIEHHAVLNTLKRLESRGFEITLIDVNKEGIVSKNRIEAAIRKETCLVTVMYANNEIGTIQPIEEIGRLCREKQIIFHTDAVQAAGHLPIDVNKQNIDMLSLSAHKFHGPKGIGALYTRKGIPLSNIMDGGTQERGKRPGTENVPAIMGMAAAFEESCQKIDQSIKKITALRERLITGLSSIPHSILNGERQNRLPGNVNFCFRGIEGEALLLLLDQKGICASSGSACSSGALEPSHVLLAIGRPAQTAKGSLRLSLGEFNTEKEIDYLIKRVTEAISRLREISSFRGDHEESPKAV